MRAVCYNPYKEVVESIAEMCEKYATVGSDLPDFLCNVRVKCKEAKEYDSMFSEPNWNPSDVQMKALNEAKDRIVALKSRLWLFDKVDSETVKYLESLLDKLKKMQKQ